MFTKDECFRLGSVAKLHGYKGEISLFLDVDDLQAYTNLESVFIEFDNRLVPFFLESIRPSGKRHVVVRFMDIETEEQAKYLIGHPLYLPLEALPETDENEFYFFEIEGFEAWDVNYGKLGTVVKVMDLAGNPIIQIDAEGKEVLIPNQEEFIESLDKTNQKITFKTPEGLIEMYLGE